MKISVESYVSKRIAGCYNDPAWRKLPFNLSPSIPDLQSTAEELNRYFNAVQRRYHENSRQEERL